MRQVRISYFPFPFFLFSSFVSSSKAHRDVTIFPQRYKYPLNFIVGVGLRPLSNYNFDFGFLDWSQFLVVRISLFYVGACFLYSLAFFHPSLRKNTVSCKKEERKKGNRIVERFSNFRKRWLQTTSMWGIATIIKCKHDSHSGYIYSCSLTWHSAIWDIM